MKKCVQILLCSLIVVVFVNVTAFADTSMYKEGDVINPPKPVVIVDGDNAGSDFYAITKSLLDGECTIGKPAPMKAELTATTYATQVSPSITTVMYLVRYYPESGKSVIVGSPYERTVYNVEFNHFAKIVTVPEKGYYYNLTKHKVGSGEGLSQTGAIYIS